MTDRELMQQALDALQRVMSHGTAVQEAKDILSAALAEPEQQWVGLVRKEMLAIIDEQQAYKETGLPMFYRDQCLDMLRATEHKLKQRNSTNIECERCGRYIR